MISHKEHAPLSLHENFGSECTCTVWIRAHLHRVDQNTPAPCGWCSNDCGGKVRPSGCEAQEGEQWFLDRWGLRVEDLPYSSDICWKHGIIATIFLTASVIFFSTEAFNFCNMKHVDVNTN